MSRKFIGALGCALLLGATGVAAHHSDAMFARDRTLELNGTVKEFQFTNPHTWLQVMVPDENGQEVEWSLEWGSPNQLGRQGVRPSTFPAGAKVTVRTNPMRDGTAGGAFIGAKLEDGKTVGRWE
ncbi:MAG TPA: DUF6152 family protein [Hyphomicrobiales bacterium]|nr:DUF6152 family protein [Hyphomicrobiales bacterium]